jgi:hypothetical protein
VTGIVLEKKSKNGELIYHCFSLEDIKAHLSGELLLEDFVSDFNKDDNKMLIDFYVKNTKDEDIKLRDIKVNVDLLKLENYVILMQRYYQREFITLIVNLSHAFFNTVIRMYNNNPESFKLLKDLIKKDPECFGTPECISKKYDEFEYLNPPPPTYMKIKGFQNLSSKGYCKRLYLYLKKYHLLESFDLIAQTHIDMLPSESNKTSSESSEDDG